MKNENLDIELIEGFQEGKLTEEERKTFNQRLLDDKDFAQNLRLHLNITEEIDVFWTNEMINKINEWEKHAKKNNSKTPVIPIQQPVTPKQEIKKNEEQPKIVPINKRRNWIRYIAAAAVLLILIIAGLQIFNTEEEQDLFTTNFEPYPDVISNRSAEDSDLLTIAMGAYGEKKYSVALITFRRYLNEVNEISPGNKKAAEFYLAISNLGAGNANTAIRQFELIGSDINSIFQKQADWYIALAYLKSNNLEKAKIQLEKIQSNTNHDYNDKADELLKALKKHGVE